MVFYGLHCTCKSTVASTIDKPWMLPQKPKPIFVILIEGRLLV